MNHIKSFLQLFITITTGMVLIIGIDTAIRNYSGFSQYIMFQILGVAAITAFVTTLVFLISPKTRRGYLLLYLLHYMLLCLITCPSGILFGWINASIKEVMIMCGYVAGVYGSVVLISYILLLNEAKNFNQALGRRRKRIE